MTVLELNQLILRRPLKLDTSLPVKVIREDEEDILVEVAGRKIWRAKRKYIRTTPKTHVKKVYCKSNMDDVLRKLPPPSFKLYHWIKSIDTDTFPMKAAAQDLNIVISTVSKSLKILEAEGLIKVVAIVKNVGYNVQVLK